MVVSSIGAPFSPRGFKFCVCCFFSSRFAAVCRGEAPQACRALRLASAAPLGGSCCAAVLREQGREGVGPDGEAAAGRRPRGGSGRGCSLSARLPPSAGFSQPRAAHEAAGRVRSAKLAGRLFCFDNAKVGTFHTVAKSGAGLASHDGHCRVTRWGILPLSTPRESRKTVRPHGFEADEGSKSPAVVILSVTLPPDLCPLPTPGEAGCAFHSIFI